MPSEAMGKPINHSEHVQSKGSVTQADHDRGQNGQLIEQMARFCNVFGLECHLKRTNTE
jgi:hypothetical protein